jgi:hypothetical protein
MSGTSGLTSSIRVILNKLLYRIFNIEAGFLGEIQAYKNKSRRKSVLLTHRGIGSGSKS